MRRAALRTGLQLAAVAAAIVVVFFSLAVGFVVAQSKPSALVSAAADDRIYVDAVDVLTALVVLGFCAILLTGVAGWRISRRSVTPLATALRQQRAFVADASHELRTPLTVLDTRLQLLERKLDRGEEPAALLADLRRDTRAMIDLVTDLLLMAEETATSLRGDPGRGCDLRPVLLAAVGDMEVLAGERAVMVSAEVQNEARLPIPETGLRRCLVVLLDNAVVHSPVGGTVRVTAGIERGQAIVRVADEGDGIVGIAPSAVFERFARGAAGNDGQRRGFGIGLALVRDLVARYAGRVLVERTSPDGTVMRLELPLARR